MSSDEKKLAFALQALNAPDPFQNTVQMHEDVLNGIDWQAGKTDAEIMHFRDSLLAGCEAAGREMWKSGICDAWFDGCNDEIKKVCVVRVQCCDTDSCLR